jgi:hypothetical protein
MKHIILSVVIIFATAATANSFAKKPASKPLAWEYSQQMDKMSGQEKRIITGISENFLSGWLKSYPIVAVYSCAGDLSLYASGMGFAIDDVKCDTISCGRTQDVRIKLDSGDPFYVKFSISEKNNEFMSLEKYDLDSKRINVDYLIGEMKVSEKLYMEVELFNTKGRLQIAEFSLRNFPQSLKRCE